MADVRQTHEKTLSELIEQLVDDKIWMETMAHISNPHASHRRALRIKETKDAIDNAVKRNACIGHSALSDIVY